MRGGVMRGSQMNTDNLSTNFVNVGAEITFDHHIQITSRAKEASIMLDDIDVRELLERVKNLELVVAKQSEIINALWYAPGAPGTWEAKEEFEKVLGIAPLPPAPKGPGAAEESKTRE